MGAEPVAVLYASISVLNLTRAATGNQCREIKRGVTWALLGSLKTSRASAFPAFAIRRASVIESSAVSVECPRLNPDWLASSRLCSDRNEDNWLKTTRSSILAMRDRSVAICKRSV